MPDPAAPRGAFLVALVVTALILGGVTLLVALARSGGPRSGRLLPIVRVLWLGLVGAVWVGLNLVSLGWVRLGRVGPADPAPVTVEVEAQVWSYRISNPQVPAGVPVLFVVRSADTLHSLGLYDPDGQLLFTLMAMPGMEERGLFTFPRPGRYRLRCLEYCGLGHGLMAGDLVVQGR